MADILSRVNTSTLDIGNILRTSEDIKTSRLSRDVTQANLNEFNESSKFRQTDRELTEKIKGLQLNAEQADYVRRATEAVTNELVTISSEQYPAFLEKWGKVSPDIIKGFPAPETFANNPQLFEAFQMKALQSGEVLKAQLVETIKQKGQTERNIQDNAAALSQATAIEDIKQKGAYARKLLEESSGTVKPNGDMANFVYMYGRKPSNSAEFAAFRRQTKDDSGLSKELKDIKDDYFQTIGRANSAIMGVGQYVKDPNKDNVAQQEYARAKELRQTFIDKGGDPSMLGESLKQKSEDVLTDVQEGTVVFNPDTKESLVWKNNTWQKFQE